jgi:hypothetical protein
MTRPAADITSSNVRMDLAFPLQETPVFVNPFSRKIVREKRLV